MIAIIAYALVLLLIYSYIWGIRKIYRNLGLGKRNVTVIIIGILIFGSIPIPLFPYQGWIVGISIGGALIPILVSYWLFREGRIDPAEGFIGVVIVSFLTYVLTRVEPGVGIVAELHVAFIPAISAAMYSLSVFWQKVRNAAPLAFFSGTIGTIIGADVFHLAEILAIAPDPGSPDFLVVGGAHIFDMVFLSGIVAVSLDLLIAHIIKKREEPRTAVEKIIKYQRDLILEYERMRIEKEREITKRSKYWDRGIPSDARYRKIGTREIEQISKSKKFEFESPLGRDQYRNI